LNVQKPKVGLLQRRPPDLLTRSSAFYSAMGFAPRPHL